jgi:wyosine [tRNA(Phe)-imidazoG37] synthetase (radical SAM superfamily)
MPKSYIDSLRTEDIITNKFFYKISCIFRVDKFIKKKILKNRLIIPYVEICITEQCSLKCKHCANFIPLYEKPQQFIVSDILKDINRIASLADAITQFRVLGGEPFLHEGLPEILRELSKHKNVKSIQIVTNGTLIPSIEILEALSQDKRCSVDISNYGNISRKKSELQNILNAHEILNYSTDNYTWLNIGDGRHHNYTKNELQQYYNECDNICKNILNGKFYICPRAAHGHKLGLLKDYTSFVDLYKGTDLEIKNKIIALYNKNYDDACNLCMPPKLWKVIPPAEQLSRK